MTWAQAVPLWITIGLALAAAVYLRRNGGGTALQELERANRVLERRVHELEQDNATLTGKVQTLTASRDVSIAIAPVLDALKLHEDRAAIRSDKTLDLLQLMADHLGRDPDAQAA
jgi:hypothetical protein